MGKQPKALEFAEHLENYGEFQSYFDDVASEMRHLYAVNQELLEALHRITPIECHMVGHRKGEFHSASEPCPVVERINATIAKATKENT